MSFKTQSIYIICSVDSGFKLYILFTVWDPKKKKEMLSSTNKQPSTPFIYCVRLHKNHNQNNYNKQTLYLIKIPLLAPTAYTAQTALKNKNV